MAKQVVDPHYATRNSEYQQVIATINKEARCPFCSDNFKYHKKPILREFKGWMITESSWPYPKTQLHLLLIAKAHHERLGELSDADWQAIGQLVAWAEKKFGLPGGALALRFGETRYTGATVCHLHAHIIVPTVDKITNRATPVIFPIG
ncbi:HIT domain-containing protein [Candidatus Berkelbacteria bacterium]|nr:HIT domain-containing protein [Candidatus Berkelbacteria bacterium]